MEEQETRSVRRKIVDTPQQSCMVTPKKNTHMEHQSQTSPEDFEVLSPLPEGEGIDPSTWAAVKRKNLEAFLELNLSTGVSRGEAWDLPLR